MKFASLSKIQSEQKGYIVGNFPGVFHKANFEVAIKKYVKGEYNPSHYHPSTNEINVILQGKAMMKSGWDQSVTYLYAGDIFLINKGEVFNFIALEDTTLVVIKDTAEGDKVDSGTGYSEETVKYLKNLGIDVDKIG